MLFINRGTAELLCLPECGIQKAWLSPGFMCLSNLTEMKFSCHCRYIWLPGITQTLDWSQPRSEAGGITHVYPWGPGMAMASTKSKTVVVQNTIVLRGSWSRETKTEAAPWSSKIQAGKCVSPPSLKALLQSQMATGVEDYMRVRSVSLLFLQTKWLPTLLTFFFGFIKDKY